jgi:hypothetical protein
MLIKVCLAHLEKYCPTVGYILSLEFKILHDFLITEEAIWADKFVLVIAVVDGSYFPTPMRQRPLVMFSNIYMIFFHQCTLINQVKSLFLTAGLLNYLSLKIALDLEAVIERKSFLIVQVQFCEECTP